jgi:hypothetical protein
MSAARSAPVKGGGAFSAKRVSWREWLGLGAGLLAAVSLFLPWSTLSSTAPEVEDGLRSLPSGDVARTAWNSDFLAWFPPILLLIAGLVVVVAGQAGKVRQSGLPQLWLVASATALVLMVIGWFAIAGQFSADQRALFVAGGIVVSGGFGRYLGLLAAVISLCAAFLDSRKPTKR